MFFLCLEYVFLILFAGISTLDFNDFWQFLTTILYSMKSKRVNDLLIVIDFEKMKL